MILLSQYYAVLYLFTNILLIDYYSSSIYLLLLLYGYMNKAFFNFVECYSYKQYATNYSQLLGHRGRVVKICELKTDGLCPGGFDSPYY